MSRKYKMIQAEKSIFQPVVQIQARQLTGLMQPTRKHQSKDSHCCHYTVKIAKKSVFGKWITDKILKGIEKKNHNMKDKNKLAIFMLPQTLKRRS